MKKLLVVLCCILVLGLGSAWAGVTGTTDPTQFNDTVDWCQFGCAGATFPSPTPFTSALGNTGVVGNVGTLQPWYNLEDPNSWNGNFPNGMGLVYNGAAYGNTPTGIAAQLDEGVYGMGAYIQANFYGTFTATITLFDINDQVLGSYSANGLSGPGNPILFIGMLDTSADVWAAQFDVSNTAGGGEDFAIGTLGLATTPAQGTPEPSSLMLLGSAIGLAGVIRRKLEVK